MSLVKSVHEPSSVRSFLHSPSKRDSALSKLARHRPANNNLRADAHARRLFIGPPAGSSRHGPARLGFLRMQLRGHLLQIFGGVPLGNDGLVVVTGAEGHGKSLFEQLKMPDL